MHIQWVFLFSLIPGAVAVIILIFFVKEIVIASKDQTSFLHIRKKKMMTSVIVNTTALVNESRAFVILMIISGILGLGAFNFSFILLKAEDFGIAASDIPLVYAVINVVHTVIGIPVGMLGDKIGKEKVLVLGYLIFIISSLLMILLSSTQYLYAYLIAAIFSFYLGIIETIQSRYSQICVFKDERDSIWLILSGHWH